MSPPSPSGQSTNASRGSIVLRLSKRVFTTAHALGGYFVHAATEGLHMKGVGHGFVVASSFCVLAAIVACGGSTSPTPMPTTPSPPPTTSPDPSISLSVVSPTGIDSLNLSMVSATGVFTSLAHLTPTNPATTTVNYTTRLSAGMYGLSLDPLRHDSSGISIRFSGSLAGNTGGVQPNSIVVVSALNDAGHITVQGCGVIVPSDVGAVDLKFDVVRADFTRYVEPSAGLQLSRAGRSSSGCTRK
jgi:hypothetical protein